MRPSASLRMVGRRCRFLILGMGWIPFSIPASIPGVTGFSSFIPPTPPPTPPPVIPSVVEGAEGASGAESPP
jgi:hypothetical protein